MAENTEQLSLGDIEDLVRDVLIKAGVDAQAASATAWAVKAAERSGDRSSGLERIPRVLEGVRMAAISLSAKPRVGHAPSNVLKIHADHGLSDAAMSVGFESLVACVEEKRRAFLVITATGDTPAPAPWIEKLATLGVRAISMEKLPGNDIVFANGAPDATEEFMEVPLDGASVYSSREIGASDDMPALQPVDGTICLMAIAKERGVDQPQLTHSDGERANRQHRCVSVPSSLLMRIVAA